MTFENVVRDIPRLSDDSWSYRDFMVSILFPLFYSENGLTYACVFLFF